MTDRRRSYASEYAAAFETARRVRTSPGGLRSFRRQFPGLSREDSKRIWNKAWERAERVKYMEDSQQWRNINKAKLQCPDGSNRLFYTFEVKFNDEDGNQHEQYFHVNIPMERTIGASNTEAIRDAVRQLRDRYFEGQHLNRMKGKISNIRMMNVRCLHGGDW
jgi:hypothetical protein